MNLWDIMSVAIQIGVPTIVWGDPGIAKTSIVRAIAEALNRPLIEVILSLCDPSDVGGLPFVKGGEQVEMSPPYWAKWALDNPTGIINFDEFGDVQQATQAAALRVILEKQVGPLKLPDTISLIAASNPLSSSTTGFDMKPAMANRFVHLYANADYDMWKEWVLGIEQSFSKVKVTEDGRSSESIHKWMVEIISFTEVNKAWHANLPKEKSKRNGPWPSHRSWEVCAKMLAAFESTLPTIQSRFGKEEFMKEMEERNGYFLEIAAACVGTDAALEFISWRKKMDLPNPEDIIKDPTSWEIPKGRADIVYTVSNNILSAIANNNSAERWTIGMDVAVLISKGGHKDAAANMAHILGKMTPSEPVDFPIEALEELSDVLQFMRDVKGR